MFLDDRLLEIGRSAELTEDGIREAINEMIKACMDNLHDNIPKNANSSAVRASFRRAKNTWATVANKLENEGRGFVKPTGFESFIKSKPEFNGIF